MLCQAEALSVPTTRYYDKMMNHKHVGVIVPAAGVGSRFGSSTPKQYLLLDGLPVLAHTLQTILSITDVSAIVVAISPEDRFFDQMVGMMTVPTDRVHTVIGGSERWQSVMNALHHSALNHADIILVHDAVRPLASPNLFHRVISAARDYPAVVPGIPISDTIKEVRSDGFVHHTIHREALRSIQTPQGFQADILRTSYERVQTNVTDDASLAEQNGVPPFVVAGEPWNLKITTATDLTLAECLIRNRE